MSPLAVGDADFSEEDIATVAGLLKLFLVCPSSMGAWTAGDGYALSPTPLITTVVSFETLFS